MLEQLERDKAERFGKKYDPSVKKEKTIVEQVESYSKAVMIMNPPLTYPGVAKSCLNTLKIILSNILKNPTEEKFRKVKKTNPNFEERVGQHQAGMKILEKLGFLPDGEFLVCSNPVTDDFKGSIEILEKKLEKC